MPKLFETKYNCSEILKMLHYDKKSNKREDYEKSNCLFFLVKQHQKSD